MVTVSARYWEDRYADGGNSGDGSQGLNAQFKADFLNAFVKEPKVMNVIEYGCGDGRQLQLLAATIPPAPALMCRQQRSS